MAGAPKKRDPVKHAAYARAWARAHPDVGRQKNLRRKAEVLERLGGARCVICGCDDVRALEVNHIRGGGGRESRSRGRAGSALLYGMILNGTRSTADLNVLCRPCNQVDYILRKHPNLSGRWLIRWVSV